MRIGLLADVHANLPALEAVIEAALDRGVRRFVCLGDLVGYHADPDACIAALRRIAAECVVGNHDLASLGEADPLAGRVAVNLQRWTAERLSAESRAYLASLPPRRDLGWGSAVHGCFINPRHVSGYITPTTAQLNLGWLASRTSGPHVGLFGHTHVPTLYGEDCDETRAAREGWLKLPPRGVVLVNPGAVGQPRDGDPRASFAVLDLELWALEFVRVAYDVEGAVRALVREGLDASLAERLRAGR